MKTERAAGQFADRSGWPVYADAPPHVRIAYSNGRSELSGRAAHDLGRRYGADSRGLHAAWSWDGETLTAQVDALGFYNLYYSADATGVAVSPSVLQLVATGTDAALDTRALGVFFRLGLFINDDTAFRHIRSLPPGGRLTWSRGRLTVTGGVPPPTIRQISQDEAVDGFIALTRASIRRILDDWPGEIVLPLSGGRDSRHILLELIHLGRAPKACVTFYHGGGGPSAEALAARAICDRVGVPHVGLGARRSRAADILRTVVLTGLCADEHYQMMPLHDHLAGQQAAALDGIGGDILSNPDDWAEDFFRLAERGDYRGIGRGMMQGHAGVISRPGWSGGAGAIHAPGLDDEVEDYVGRSIAGFAAAPDPYQAFWFWNRTRREVALVPTAMFGTAPAVYCPFLDPEVVAFCLSLPYRITRDQQLHNLAMARAYPASADVPFAEAFRDPPTPRLARPLSKARAVLDAVRVIRALEPEQPLHEIARFIRGSDKLHRTPDLIYRIYRLCLEGLDARKARRLLSLAARP